MKLVLSSAPLSAAEQYGPMAPAMSSDACYGLLSLAASAREAGADVSVVDASAECIGIDETLDEILALNPDMVGITSTSPGIMPTGDLAAELKKRRPEMPIIVGGCHISAIYEETMQTLPGIDIAVIGEGEQTLVDLIGAFESGGDIDNIPGTAVREPDGAIRRNVPRAYGDMDDLPLPAWDLLRGFPEAFRPTPDRYKKLPTATLILSRGCPYKCKFCDQTVFEHKRRAYSPHYIIRMIKDLRDNYGVREISILDSIFALNKKQTKELCQLMIDEKLNMSWMCHTVTNSADLGMFQMMKKAGCWMVAFGIESGDQSILDAMDKRQNPEQIRKAVYLAKKAGLKIKGFFLLGFPGETEETMENTRKFALSLPIDIMHAFLFSPFPGTEVFHNSPEDVGTYERDWRKMNCMSPVFIPKDLTAEKLDDALKKMARDFYFRPRIIWGHFLLCVNNPRMTLHMFKSFLALIHRLMQKTPKPSRSLLQIGAQRGDQIFPGTN